MQVVFVRHAQSANNVIQEGISRAEFERIRHHDAPLSDLGERQTIELGAGISSLFTKPPSPYVRDLIRAGKIPSRRRVHVAVSPMRRTLLTAKPLLDTLQKQHDEGDHILLAKVEVVPFLFELGGCYREQAGVYVGQSGLTRKEMNNILPNAAVPDALENGWWKGSTKETEEELELRVIKTIEWIRKLAHSQTCDVLILVMHQDFSCAVMRGLCGAQGLRWLYNTSLSSLTLLPVHSEISEGITSDGLVSELHECNVVLDWINSIEHLSLENIC